jgi:hypothetical protein
MAPTGFKPVIPASERSQNHTLDRTATGIGPSVNKSNINSNWLGIEPRLSLQKSGD